jgi:hypothetical protein
VARALYRPAPTKSEAAAFGFTIEEVGGSPAEIWPVNLRSVNVFIAMDTQWFVGARGPTGLRYEALPEIWRRTKTPIADRDAIFEDLRVMEQVALAEMRKS